MKTLVARHPQALVWRGVVHAGALWFEFGLVPEVAARRRILALWQPGDRVERHETGLLLRFAAPRRIVCAQAPGAPLVLIAGRLISAPLPELAVRELQAPEGTAVLVHAEAPLVLPRGREEDPALWLEVSGWRVETLQPLGEVPPPPDLLPVVMPDARAALGLAPPDAELASVLNMLYHPPERSSGTGQLVADLGAFLRRLLSLPEPRERSYQFELPVLQKPFFWIITLAIVLLVFGSLAGAHARFDPLILLRMLAIFAGVAGGMYLLQASGLLGWFGKMGEALGLRWLFQRSTPSAPVEVKQAPAWVSKAANAALTTLAVGIFVLLICALSNPWRTLVDGLLVIFFLVLGILVLTAVGAGVRMVGAAVKETLGGAGAGAKPAAASPASPRPASDNFLGRRLMSFFGRAILLSRLGGVIGRRQAAYIGRMMEMFERGDFENALRHAIPLGGDLDAGNFVPALGVPQPRADIQIRPHAASGGKALMMAGLEEHLRPLYRRAFERLAAQGRFKEAAYVLAELLRADAEAVSFLEQHGELRLAAEVAEARKLSADLVVRQWFIAGDRRRAVRVARLHSAFAGAIQRLEKEERRVEAEALRLLWADALARAGDFENAVEQVWAVESAKAKTSEQFWADNSTRPLALEWMRLGMELGGAAGARLLARHLQMADAEWEAAKPYVEALLAGAGPDAARHRAEFARKLPQVSNPRTQLVARHTARALLRDLQSGETSLSNNNLSNLVRLAADGALRADLPASKTGSHSSAVTEFGTVRIEAADRGSVPVQDAILLPDGSTLIGLGELGARWLGWNENVKAQFDQPAHRLVPYLHGNGALLLAERGEATRIARVDLTSHRCAFWHEAILDAVAPRSDGSLWFAAMNGRILAIDLAAESFGKLWDSGELPGRCLRLEWGPKAIAALVRNESPPLNPEAAPAPMQLWAHSLPELYLRSRLPVEATRWAELHSPECGIVLEYVLTGSNPLYFGGSLVLVGGSAGPVCIRFPSETVELPPKSAGGQLGPLQIQGEWIVAPVREAGGCTCYLVSINQRAVKGSITLEGASRLNTRLGEGHLTVSDDLGRVLVLNLTSGQLEKNWRVR